MTTPTGLIDSEANRSGFPVRPIHIGYALFLLMLIVPTTYPLVKAPALAVVCLLATFALGKGHTKLHPTILYFTVFYAVLGTFFILLGSFRGNPGALRSAPVYVIWPIVFVLIGSGIRDIKDVAGVLRVLIVGGLVIECLSLAFVLYSRGQFPVFPSLELGQEFGSHRGYVEFGLYSLTSLIFLLPFLLATLLTWPRENPTILPRPVLWIATLLGFVVMLLSARRGLILIVLLSPAIFLCFPMFLPQEKTAWRSIILRLGLLAMLGLVAFQYSRTSFGLDAESLVNFTQQGFNAERIRPDQLRALIDSWYERPFFGSGLGGVSPYLVRSTDSPWTYELSYFALLFHVGLVGLIGYASGIGWITWKAVHIIRSGGQFALMMISVISGTLAFLIGNATNPYLEKFDFMWVLFMPIAFINRWLVDQDAARGLIE